MNLVGYSDSESDGEAAPAPVPKPALKQAPKPSFAKVVDRSNPGKIRVNLPGASLSQTPKDDIESEAPPAKKPRLGGSSAFGGFNAMLPAPKKAAATTTPAAATSGKRGLGKGLAAGVSLKTGAEPAFQRVSRAEVEEYDENGNPVKKEPMNKDDFRAMLNLPPPKSDKKESPKPDISAPSPQPELDTQPKPAAPRFVPMSVGKGKKKKPVVARSSAVSTENTKPVAGTAPEPHVATAPAPPRKPKVSLFGAPSAELAPINSSSTAEYQPLLHGTEENDTPSVPGHTFAAPASHYSQSPAIPNTAAPNELTSIASELNLSEAEKRQLFGKKGRGADFASARIVEFNTDTEYAHNEKLRQQGEQVQHNPLKSISGTGKNSLRSLVNVASTQKDALEDHFAAGYRNKKEAGNRYGW